MNFDRFKGSWGGANTYYPMPGITYKGGVTFAF